MIFHLLIVDDEGPIRNGLSQFIDWDSIDCIVDDTACDGLDAIEKLHKYNINIVITDIKMPEADGLALSKYIHENFPEVMVIILSGYADFSYAQTAIQYNVADFLLKPTSKDQLIEAVQNVQKRLITSKAFNQVAGEEITFLKDQLLQELTDTQITAPLRTRLQNYKIQLDSYFIAAFQLLAPSKDLNFLKNIITKQKHNNYCYRYNNLLLSIYFTEDKSSDTLSSILHNCKEIQEIMDSLYSLDTSIGISRYHTSSEEFAAAASEAIHALTLNFYSDSKISLFRREHNLTDYTLTTEDTLTLYNLETYLYNWDFKSAFSAVTAIFTKLKSQFAKSIDVKNICIQIYYITSRILMKKELGQPPAEILHRIQTSSAIFQLQSIIQELLEYTESSLTKSGKGYSQIVENSISYIHANLANPLSLDIIANHVHVNSSHLSRTFKKECKESITEYINKSRIKRAQEILSNSNTLAYEVSEQVGFRDPAYFSSIFKKYTGYSPKEYKQKCLPPPPTH